MKIYGISDNVDTAVGLRLAGIDTIVLHEKQEILNKLNEHIEDKEIGIIAVTNKAYEIISKEIEDIIENRNLPLIIKIPDRHGS